MPDYHEAFRIGEQVRIADLTFLRAFQASWTYFHALTEEQINYADKICFVRHVNFYHGGDCLYELGTYVLDADQLPETRFTQSHEEAIPGYWHETCLRETHYDEWDAQLPPATEIYKVTAEVRLDQPLVVVQTQTGVECLIKRCLANEREAEAMNEVASQRNALGFEQRYEFDGLMQDARRERYRNMSKP